jgi:thiol-disulfide isomerase/thioredoxin
MGNAGKEYLVALAFLCCSNSFAQQKMSINVRVTGILDVNKIKVSYDNGRKIIVEKNYFTGNNLIISDSFYSRYASLYLEYPNKHGNPFRVSFFIDHSYSTIIIKAQDSFSNPFATVTATNAYDYRNMGEAKCKKFIGEAQADFDKFYSSHQDSLANNDSLVKIYFEKSTALCQKKIDFIKRNGYLYYSFWLFRTQVSHYTFLTPDSLLMLFNRSFSSKWRNSTEGKDIVNFLEAKMNTNLNHRAPQFVATDIHGQEVSLENYKNKYVILDFWASWCIPCIEEIPALKEIRKAYSQDELEIISFSGDTDSTSFLKAVNKYRMDWRHVYGSWPFKKIYIRSGIPQIYLIDQRGLVIYNSDEQKDNKELTILKNTLEECK